MTLITELITHPQTSASALYSIAIWDVRDWGVRDWRLAIGDWRLAIGDWGQLTNDQ
ncbi:MAG: hypothetical protein HEQ35_31315 [Gloeotrichia echinulata IR180]